MWFLALVGMLMAADGFEKMNEQQKELKVIEICSQKYTKNSDIKECKASLMKHLGK